MRRTSPGPTRGAFLGESPSRVGTRRRLSAPTRTLAVGALAAMSLSACQWTSPVQTDATYEPADGTSVSVGQVRLTNLLVVAKAKGATGVVSGQVTNGSDQQVKVTVGSTSVDVAPGAAAQLTGATIPSVQADPGSIITLPVQTSVGNTQVQDVPVLAPQLEYATLTPSPTSTGTPSQTSGGSPTESASSAPSQSASTPSENATPTFTPTSTDNAG